jgi:hypothetical protein
MSLKDKFENWIDPKWGGKGKTVRKILEQFAHAAVAGACGFLVVNWLPDGLAWQIPTAVVVALLLGGVREYFQNVGDEPDDETLFSLGKLPVNGDMLIDMGAYGIGGMVAGLLGFAI